MEDDLWWKMTNTDTNTNTDGGGWLLVKFPFKGVFPQRPYEPLCVIFNLNMIITLKTQLNGFWHNWNKPSYSISPADLAHTKICLRNVLWKNYFQKTLPFKDLGTILSTIFRTSVTYPPNYSRNILKYSLRILPKRIWSISRIFFSLDQLRGKVKEAF